MCHAYVVLYAICVVYGDFGLVCDVLSHTFFLDRACFFIPTGTYLCDLAMWLGFLLALFRNFPAEGGGGEGFNDFN